MTKNDNLFRLVKLFWVRRIICLIEFGSISDQLRSQIHHFYAGSPVGYLLKYIHTYIYIYIYNVTYTYTRFALRRQ